MDEYIKDPRNKYNLVPSLLNSSEGGDKGNPIALYNGQSVGKQLPYVPEFSAAVTGCLSWRTWSLLYKWCYYSQRYPKM